MRLRSPLSRVSGGHPSFKVFKIVKSYSKHTWKLNKCNFKFVVNDEKLVCEIINTTSYLMTRNFSISHCNRLSTSGLHIRWRSRMHTCEGCFEIWDADLCLWKPWINRFRSTLLKVLASIHVLHVLDGFPWRKVRFHFYHVWRCEAIAPSTTALMCTH